jgi:uncharacterized membrane protein YdbT with pleckstrin-like domain
MGMYVQSSISGSEKQLSAFKLHPLVWLLPALTLGVGFLLLVATLLIDPPSVLLHLYLGAELYLGVSHQLSWFLTGLIGFIFLSIKSVLRLLSLYFIEQALTTRRVIFKYGIVTLSTDEILVKNIETVSVSQSFVGKILGYGNIRITGTGSHPVHLFYITNPIDAKIRIEDAIVRMAS